MQQNLYRHFTTKLPNYDKSQSDTKNLVHVHIFQKLSKYQRYALYFKICRQYVT